ncbi:MAG TPA: aminomethyl-transferring glycine dehydrogenase subunit GcvPB, partial [Ruania sp.]|nr:aminomethyl-transferring glycine dehydrogenase subunit GcvPB [Ruania sp.]
RHAHDQARTLATRLQHAGLEVVHEHFFDTLTVHIPAGAHAAHRAALEQNITVHVADADHLRISCDETTTGAHLEALVRALAPQNAAGSETPGAQAPAHATDRDAVGTAPGEGSAVPTALQRTSEYLTHPVFTSHHSETQLMRYLRRLADKDYALDRGMIPLGSCTMKLNAAVEMAAVTWPEFAAIHPQAPAEDVRGYLSLIEDLQRQLAELTGYAAVSLQPNAGSQGELAGLLAIRRYHEDRGQGRRNVCVVPASAHGTNAASAVLAGLEVVMVATAENGDVDIDDLGRVLAEKGETVAAIMLTYPSTHGVYEAQVQQICAMVHEAGGQVYIDGANLNALLGWSRPGRFGGDVSHLNLHKTFCIPHGGGGPGVGPVAVAEHLVDYLPGHPCDPAGGPAEGAVSAAAYGSPSILPISWAYLRLMGAEGLREATGAAVLAANYLADRLQEAYPVLYRGKNDLVAHECIVDLRPLTEQSGITVDDVCKRLIDYGFHAPTMSFPVAGTLMVEPTESEDLPELDRFADAMLAIHAEAMKVADGTWPAEDNPLVNAPHTAAHAMGEWTHPYTRTEAVYPLTELVEGKYWPPVRRVDGAYGDRNLVCACPPVSAFAT